ncbi:MAG: hypothetical protein K8R53_06370, partial [Bacteroidales bacterium]|nr:hypothetical protein [Bacteroidales bacterium]
NSNVVDWILIELRDTTGGQGNAVRSARLDSKAGYLLNYGKVTGLDGSRNLKFYTTPDYDLYAIVWHRNHIGVMSAYSITKTGGIYTHDFSSGSGQVYGGINGHKEVATGVWGMIGGDGDGNGQVNNGDKNDIWAIQAGTGGYKQGDFDMNSQVNNGDKNDIWIPNTGLGGQVPD